MLGDQARSGGLLDDLENELQARSLFEFGDTATAKAELVSKRIIEAYKAVLKELRCGAEVEEPPPPLPTGELMSLELEFCFVGLKLWN